jgi:hypothetical protein
MGMSVQRRAVCVVTAGLLLAACGGGGTSAGSAGSNAATTSTQTGRTDTGAQQTAYPSATDAPSGGAIADTGFNPASNGFAFQNYGNEIPGLVNLTPVEMRDMFGDVVCVNMQNGCTLTPEAQAWMDQKNSSMSGGHCQGMSVTSLLFYKGVIKPSDYGGGAVPDLNIQGNEALQRRIAESFQYQYFPAVKDGTIHGTPSQIVDALVAAMQSKTTTYGLGIYKADRSGGHEITPISVVDRGGGKVAILVYDNNYPKNIREVNVDRNANTWTYNGSTNPDVTASDYQGDASTNTLEIDPLEPGESKQPCPFCAASTAAQAAYRVGPGVVQAANPAPMEEIFLDGNPNNHAHLLITDSQKRHLGYLDGKFVNEIPGATADFARLGQNWAEAEEPVYMIPTGTDISVVIDGTPLVAPDTENIGMIGPTDDVIVEGINLKPGVLEAFAVSADRNVVSYIPHTAETPTIIVGVTDANADYAFALKASGLGSDATLAFGIDPNQLIIDTTGVSADGTYDVQMERIDSTGTLTFKHPGVAVPGGVKADFVYGVWNAAGTAIPLVIDRNGSQSTTSVTDQP